MIVLSLCPYDVCVAVLEMKMNTCRSAKQEYSAVTSGGSTLEGYYKRNMPYPSVKFSSIGPSATIDIVAVPWGP